MLFVLLVSVLINCKQKKKLHAQIDFKTVSAVRVGQLLKNILYCKILLTLFYLNNVTGTE